MYNLCEIPMRKKYPSTTIIGNAKVIEYLFFTRVCYSFFIVSIQMRYWRTTAETSHRYNHIFLDNNDRWEYNL